MTPSEAREDENFPAVMHDGIAPRWAGPLFLILAIGLIPWIIFLAVTLPSHTETSHYRTAWVGFDILLAITLLRTAWLATKGRRQMELPAIASATLLVVDAWFDIMTSKAGTAQMEAIFLAVFIELPAAALALYLSSHIERVIDLSLRATSNISVARPEPADMKSDRSSRAKDRPTVEAVLDET